MRHWMISFFLLAASLAWGMRAPARAGDESLVLVVHPHVRTSSVSMAELRALFLQQSTTIQDERLIPLNYAPRSLLRVRFDDQVLDMSPDEVGRYWVDARIRGGGSPPRVVPGPEIMVRLVPMLGGAIAYVPRSFAESARVKILRVGGKLPGEPGYPL